MLVSPGVRNDTGTPQRNDAVRQRIVAKQITTQPGRAHRHDGIIQCRAFRSRDGFQLRQGQRSGGPGAVRTDRTVERRARRIAIKGAETVLALHHTVEQAADRFTLAFEPRRPAETLVDQRSCRVKHEIQSTRLRLGRGRRRNRRISIGIAREQHVDDRLSCHAVDAGVVVLAEPRHLTRLESFDVVERPQRFVARQRRFVQTRHHRFELQPRTRRTEHDTRDMVVYRKRRIIDPHRLIERERRRLQPSAHEGDRANAIGEIELQLIEEAIALRHVQQLHRADVHRIRRAFHVEERCIGDSQFVHRCLRRSPSAI